MLQIVRPGSDRNQIALLGGQCTATRSCGHRSGDRVRVCPIPWNADPSGLVRCVMSERSKHEASQGSEGGLSVCPPTGR